MPLPRRPRSRRRSGPDGLADEKHGVSFREAKELFTSKVDFLELYDGEHSELEERFIAIGPIRRGLVLVVHTERSEDTVRIISARWATRNERALYLEYMEKRS
jgi:uncharacterized DUF497 family protein